MEALISIREMRITDLDEALKLWYSAFKAGYSSTFDTIEMLTNYLERNPEFSTVARNADEELVGALLCGHDGRRGSIYHTAVDVNHMGLGIGRKMEIRSTSKLKEIGIGTGFLFINIKNPGSKEFWENIGWQVISDIRYLYKEF